MAGALLKEIYFEADCFGEELQLCYLRNKDGRGIDFLVTRNAVPELMIEVKWGAEKLNADFKIFEKFLPKVRSIQLVKELNREKTYPDGAEVRKAHHWLAHLSL